MALAPGVLQSQQPGTPPEGITIERLVSSEFKPRSLPPTRWLDEGAAYTTIEPSAAVPGGSDIVSYVTATGERRVLVSASRLIPRGGGSPLEIDDYDWSPDRSRLLVYTNAQKVWRQRTRGDYWVLDLGTGTLRKLGGTAAPATLMFATWSPDGTRVAYARRDLGATRMATNLYVEDVATGRVTQLTRDAAVRTPGGSGATVINGTGDWVYEEEFDLRQAFEWSPDGSRVAYWQFDATAVRDFYLLDNIDSLYSTIIPVPYPKAGTANSRVRVGVVEASGGETTWLAPPGNPDSSYIARLAWSPDSRQVVLQYLDRPQQTLTLLAADARTGATTPIVTEHDSTWVDVVDDFQWLNGGRSFLWVSERDGWRHVYAVSRDGRERRLVTRGGLDAISVAGVDERGGWLYFIASPDNPTQRYLYRARLDGRRAPERVTPRNFSGTNDYAMSPDAHWALQTYSTFDTPPVTTLVRLPDHAAQRRMVANDSLARRAAPLITRPTEFFRVDAKTGQDTARLDGWLIRPPGFDSTRTYPVLVHVYSEPAAQTVLDAWNPGDMWNRYAASLGYVVLSVDNRGTPAPRGRAWRHVVYGSVGVLAAEEQAAALRALETQRPYLDTTRVGVWGWSGGGSMTLHLMFRHPDLYRMGMSVAPVSDQRLYDTIYQERYMNTPQANPEGYRRGSPISYAGGLAGKLLLVCGTGDDNVHYQSCEVLLDRLIALGKPVDFMAYPMRTHALAERDGTVPHFYHLLTRYLTTNLPAGGR
jgi:dipeptidyl-peptidase-4